MTSVYRILRFRSLNPTKAIADALKIYLTTGNSRRYVSKPLQTADFLPSDHSASLRRLNVRAPHSDYAPRSRLAKKTLFSA